MQLPAAQPLEFAAVYRANYSFVWRTLRHLGVDPAQVDDAAQDAFLVVYRRLPEFAGRAAVRTWLFEIARRVASRYRRSAAREAPRRCALAEAEVATSSAAAIEQAEAAEVVRLLLGELDRDKAVVFVLAELGQWQAPEIAAELAVNLNTVYSRLRAARKQLDRLVRRLDARSQRGCRRDGAQILGALLVVGPPLPPVWHSGPARDPAARFDMFESTWSIEQMSSSVGVAATGGNTALGLSFAGAGLALLLAFGGGARPPDPPPAAEPVAHAPPAQIAAGPAPVAAAPVALPEPVTAATPAASASARRPGPAKSGLVAELALVESLRAAVLAGDDRATLNLVARHRRRFPGGVFVQEAAAAAIEVHCRRGERERTRREAAAFLARWPASPLSARVAALCRS